MHTVWRNKRYPQDTPTVGTQHFLPTRESWIWQVRHMDVVVKSQCKQMNTGNIPLKIGFWKRRSLSDYLLSPYMVWPAFVRHDL